MADAGRQNKNERMLPYTSSTYLASHSIKTLKIYWVAILFIQIAR